MSRRGATLQTIHPALLRKPTQSVHCEPVIVLHPYPFLIYFRGQIFNQNGLKAYVTQLKATFVPNLKQKGCIDDQSCRLACDADCPALSGSCSLRDVPCFCLP